MVKLTRRHVLASGGAMAGALSLGIPAVRSAEPLRIGLPGVYTPYAVLMYADKQGYFSDAPIEITTYRGGAATQEALAAGAADVISIAPPTAALAIQKGIDQKIVALSGPPTPGGWFLLVPADSDIKDVKDLEGKKIGITSKGSTTDFLSAWTADQAGISFSPIPLGGTILPGLKARQVDAGVVYPLVSFAAIESGEFRPLQDYGKLIKGATFDIWTATTAAIEGKADAAKVFLGGIGKALDELHADRELALKAIADYHDEQDRKILELAYESLIAPMRPDGKVSLDEIQGSLDIVALAGITGLPDAKAITDLSLL